MGLPAAFSHRRLRASTVRHILAPSSTLRQLPSAPPGPVPCGLHVSSASHTVAGPLPSLSCRPACGRSPRATMSGRT